MFKPRNLVLFAIVLSATGCGSGGGNQDIPPPPDMVDGKFVFKSEDDAAASPTTPEFDWSKAIAFKPPNPRRKNPFAVKSSNTKTGSDSFSSSDHAEDDDGIRVKGFVNRNGMRVVMRVGDQFRSLREGESIGKVEVLKISPPQVTIAFEGKSETRSIHDEPIDNESNSDGGGFGGGGGDADAWNDTSQEPPSLTG